PEDNNTKFEDVKWEEDYLNRHVQRSGCKANEGQRTIYNWFQPVKQNECIEKEDKYDSDIYDNMDNDDLIQVNEIDNDSDQEFQAINIEERFENLWVILADKALKGAFNDLPIFTGLCEVMIILGGISSRALDLFRQNLAD
ncbi:21302_t:CDS:2, partial [Gigaspora rosea]